MALKQSNKNRKAKTIEQVQAEGFGYPVDERAESTPISANFIENAALVAFFLVLVLFFV